MHELNAFIVEDSQVIRDNLIATLEEVAPVIVIGHAADEADASRQLTRLADGCDIVIVDLFLRQGSGMSLLRTLGQRGHRAHRVVLTNYATPEIRHQCLQLGADRVFDKSGQIDDLIEHCRRLSELRGGPTTGSV